MLDRRVSDITNPTVRSILRVALYSPISLLKASRDAALRPKHRNMDIDSLWA